MTVAKLRGARERKRREVGKCEGRKSHAERNPELVALAKRLHRRKPKGGRMSLRAISAELATQGFLNENGRPFAAASVTESLHRMYHARFETHRRAPAAPEKFGLQVGGQYVVLDSKAIGPLREQIKEARKNDQPFVEFGDDKTRIPATAEAERSLWTLLGEVSPNQDYRKADTHKANGKDQPSKQKHVLIV